jgi:ABC-type Mn2+/Zn2+ transport system permease subunit
VNSFFEILSPSFVLRNSLYSSLLIGLTVPPVGVFLVLGQRSILALTLPQVSTLGVALVVWLGSFFGVHFASGEGGGGFLAWALFGSMAAMSLALAWQWLLERRLNSSPESESGGMYAFAAALTLALAASRRVSELGLLDRLKGEILAVPTSLLILQSAGFAVILLTVFLFSRPFQFVLFDRMLCYASGLPADLLYMLITVLVAGTIALGGLCAGPLTVFAFLILPPLSCLPFVKNLRTLYWSSAFVGIACAFVGFWASYAWEDWNLPIPAAQISLLGLLWLIARLLALLRFRSRRQSSKSLPTSDVQN